MIWHTLNRCTASSLNHASNCQSEQSRGPYSNNLPRYLLLGSYIILYAPHQFILNNSVYIPGPSDELLDVRINYCSTVSTAEVYCNFPREEFISDQCKFEYWTDPDDHVVQTSNSQSSNGITSPLSVKLMPGTLYYYSVSASNESLLLNVTVQGTFLTAELGEFCHCKAVGAT